MSAPVLPIWAVDRRVVSSRHDTTSLARVQIGRSVAREDGLPARDGVFTMDPDRLVAKVTASAPRRTSAEPDPL